MSRAFFAAALCFMSGCLITADPSVEDPVNLPPSVEGRAPTPMTQMVRIPRLDGPGGAPDAGVASVQTQFFFTVRDANVDDMLVGRIYLNLDRDGNRPQLDLVDEIEIMPDQDENPYARERDFSIQNSEFRDELADGLGPCMIVELHVSRAFAGASSLLPDDPGPYGDLGVGVWYAVVEGEDGADYDLERCLEARAE